MGDPRLTVSFKTSGTLFVYQGKRIQNSAGDWYCEPSTRRGRPLSAPKWLISTSSI